MGAVGATTVLLAIGTFVRNPCKGGIWAAPLVTPWAPAFDLTDGAKVVFGSAVRPLPQLPITVGDDGYFAGPSFWEIHASS